MAEIKLRHRAEVTEARFLRARDGDTIEVLLKVGYGVWLETPIRIVEIESFELDSEQEKEALEARAFIDLHLKDAMLTIHPAQGGKDKYGRLRARVYKGETDISDWLIISGRAWRVPPTHTHAHPSPRPANRIVEAKL